MVTTNTGKTFTNEEVARTLEYAKSKGYTDEQIKAGAQANIVEAKTPTPTQPIATPIPVPTSPLNDNSKSSFIEQAQARGPIAPPLPPAYVTPKDSPVYAVAPKEKKTILPTGEVIMGPAPTTTAPVTPTQTTPALSQEKTPTPTQPAPIQEIPTSPTEAQLPQSIEEWKNSGGSIDTLTNMINSKYNTSAQYDPATNTITAEIGGQKNVWNFDEGGNPIKSTYDNTDTLYNKLVSGQNVDNNNPSYPQAKAMYDIVSQYNGMTEQDLYNAYVNNEITPQLEQKLAGNPNLALAKQKYTNKQITDSINYENQTILSAYNRANDKPSIQEQTQNELDRLNQKYDSLFSSMGKTQEETLDFQTHLARTYPEIINETTELNAKSKQLDEFVTERDNRLDTIIEENPGISLNRAIMLASRQNKDINKQIDTLTREIKNLSSNIDFKTQMADKQYGYYLQQQTRNDNLEKEKRGYAFDMYQSDRQNIIRQGEMAQTREWQLEDTASSRAYETQKTAEERAYNEQKLQRELDLKLQYENPDINSENPALRDLAIRNAVADLYVKYPIVGMESQATKEAKVRDMITKGMTPSQAIAQLETEIRNTDSYKNMINAQNKQWIGSPETAPTPWTKLNDTTLYNEIDGTTKSISELSKGATIQDLLSVPNGTLIPTRVEAFKDISNGGKQCAEFVNDMTGLGLPDTLEGKMSKMTSFKKTIAGVTSLAKGELGATAVWTPKGGDERYGHTGVIVGEEGDNWIIRSSNIKGDGTITTDLIPKSDILGINNDPKYNVFNKLEEQKNNRQVSDKEWTQINQTITGFKADPQVKAFEEAYAQGQSLLSSLNNASGPGDVASIFQFMKTLDPSSVVRESEFETAAKSAGVGAYIGNTYDRLMKGQKLTEEQRKAFGELAKQFIVNRSNLYETKYQDGIRRLELQGLPTGFFPTNISQNMKETLGMTSTGEIEEVNTLFK